jgi:hypothetical protein
MLVVVVFLLSEILAKFSNSSVNSVQSAPTTMIF